MLFDKLGVGDVIIDTHLTPTPVPELFFVRAERLMLRRVLGTAVIAAPDVIAFLGQNELEGQTRGISVHPKGGITVVTMLEDHGRHSGLEHSLTVTSDVESCKNESVLSVHLEGLPRKSILVHGVSESFILHFIFLLC